MNIDYLPHFDVGLTTLLPPNKTHIWFETVPSGSKSILFKPGLLQTNWHHPFLPIIVSISNIILHQNTVSRQSRSKQNTRFYLLICLKKMGIAGHNAGQTESQWVSDVDQARQNDATSHTIGQGIEWCALGRQMHASEQCSKPWLVV